MKEITNKINGLLTCYKLEYIKMDGEYWLLSEHNKKGIIFSNKSFYSTNTRNKKDFYNWLVVQDLKDLYHLLK